MALIKCKECGHEMSSRAQVCPNCGCPNDYEETSSATAEESVKPTADNTEKKEEPTDPKLAEIMQKIALEKEAEDELKAKKIVKAIASWIFLILAAIAFFTNPSKEDHVDAYYDYLTGFFAQVDRDNNLGGQVVANMEKDKSNYAQYFNYGDFVVFSRGDGTFGIFGHVFIVATDEEKEALKKQIIDAYK